MKKNNKKKTLLLFILNFILLLVLFGAFVYNLNLLINVGSLTTISGSNPSKVDLFYTLLAISALFLVLLFACVVLLKKLTDRNNK